MLKLLEQYIGTDGSTVEIFKTSHSGPDYHVRYGLQVKAFEVLKDARKDFKKCISHIRQCNAGEV